MPLAEPLSQRGGARHGFPLNLVKHARKEIPCRSMKEKFIGKDRLQARPSLIAFIARDLLSVGAAQEKGHLVLREARSLSMAAKIIGKRCQRHGWKEVRWL